MGQADLRIGLSPEIEATPMRKEIPVPALVAIVVVAVLAVVGIGWYAINREPPLREPVIGGASPAHKMSIGQAGKPMPGARGIDVP